MAPFRCLKLTRQHMVSARSYFNAAGHCRDCAKRDFRNSHWLLREPTDRALMPQTMRSRGRTSSPNVSGQPASDRRLDLTERWSPDLTNKASLSSCVLSGSHRGAPV